MKEKDSYIISLINNKDARVGRFKRFSVDVSENLVIEIDIDNESYSG